MMRERPARPHEPGHEADGDRRFREEVRLKTTRISTAVDGIAVYVHKDSPIEKLTLPQVTRSSPRRARRHSGEGQDLGDRSQATGPRRRSALRAQLASGKLGLQEHALYRETSRHREGQPGSAAVVQGVKGPYAIGYRDRSQLRGQGDQLAKAGIPTFGLHEEVCREYPSRVP